MYAVSDATGAADPCHSAPQANASDPSPIQVCLFGGLTLLKHGEPLAWRGGAKTETLLLSLALEAGRGVTRERLLTHLWPGAEPSLATQSLHSLVHNLHRLLGDAIGGAPPIVHTAEIYRINAQAGIAVDVTEFEALARRGDRYWDAAERPIAGGHYREAITLYRGDLHACTDDSAVVERERLRAWYLVMLGRLADIARRDHDYSSAIEYASLVLKYDAAREDAHRTLMCCYAQFGERVQAMRQFLLCERLLQEAFDAVPQAATRQLYDRLRLSPGGVFEEV